MTGQQMGGQRAQTTIVDAEHFDRSLGMIGDQLDNLRGDLRDLIASLPAAMAEAQRQVLTDPKVIEDVMGKVVTTAQRRAAEKTGNAVGSMLKSLFTRWIIIGCILLLVAKTAGVDVAAKVWATVKGAA